MRRLADRLADLGAIILMALMVMTAVDVVGRYVFNSPLKGGTELTEFMLSALIFCAVPIVALTGGHVIVELINWRLPPRLAALSQRILFGMLAAVHGVLALGVWRLAARSVKRNELSEYLQLPVGYVQYFAVSCLAVTALVCLWRCLGPLHASQSDTATP